MPMKLRPLAAVMAVAFAAPSLAAESVTQMIVKFDNEKVRAQALAEGVRLPTTGERLNALSATLGEVVSYQRPMSGGADVIRFTHPVDMERAQAMASVLSERSDVAWAEPDARMYIRRVPNDPRYAEQWSLHASVTGQPVGQNNYGLDMPAAWSLLTGASTPVVVAVLDSGILPQHEDLAGRVLPGYDMISPPEVANDNDPAGAANSRDPDPTDAGDWITQAESDDPNGPYQGCEVHPSSWHGSHVAGIIGAGTDNGLGVAGINWGARILPVRVLGKCGGLTSDIADGIRWAAGIDVPGVPANPNPARILNLSLGGEGECGPVYQSAIDEVHARGAILFVAAGNENDDMNVTPKRPANCAKVITVAATDRDGQRAPYSNYGARVDIAAPGGFLPTENLILSTVDSSLMAPNGDSSYKPSAGTSQATPHAAGVASLMLARMPSLSFDQVRDILRQSATPFPAYGAGLDCTTATCGAGILNAAGAVAATPTAHEMPDAFLIPNKLNVPLSTPVVSDAVTITGINVPVRVRVSNGEYSIGCNGQFTAADGVIENGQTVCVRHTSASTYNTRVSSTLTVGSVSKSYSTNFDSETVSPPPAPSDGGGGATHPLWLMLAALPLALRRRP